MSAWLHKVYLRGRRHTSEVGDINAAWLHKVCSTRDSDSHTSTYKQLCRPIWDCGGWVPEKSWSYHYWQPAPRWRPHWWLAKPDNPAMSPHDLDKTGTRHTDTQWKAKGGEGREQKPLNAPHIKLLLPAQMSPTARSTRNSMHAQAY